MHADLISALNEIEDPELGIGIVDLGLVINAQWSAAGIEVEFITTASTCPFGDVLLTRIDELLHQRFAEATAIRVRMVLHPPWSPERLSEAARRKLGWTETPGSMSDQSAFGAGRGFWKN